MKHQFLKSALILSSVLAFMNCSEEAANALDNLDPAANQPTENDPSTDDVSADTPCWLLNADQPYLIYTAGIVTDINGTVVGTFVFESETTGSIVAADGKTILVNNVDTNDLPLTDRATVAATTPATPASSAGTSTQNPTPTQSSVTDSQTLSSGTETTPVASSSSEQTASNNSSSSEQQQQPKSSAAVSSNCDGKCFDNVSGKCVDSYAQLTGSKGEKYAYDNSCKLNCYYDPDGKDCKSISGSAPASSASQQAKSSSSQQQQQKSSSSQQQAKSSSSQQQPKSSSSQQQQQGGSLLPKIVSGAQSKSGYATRYWDSCKPHCAWEGKGGPVARTCNADGVTKASSDASSVCDGGNAGTCFDQTPQIVNDTIAYAFAATPGGGNDCGKCYMLTFKGTGASATKTPTDSHHKAIKGKHLIVMSSNIGYDVSHNQFDLMIPGGGPGAYNGCAKMGISCAGAQYGGFLTTCNYKKDCLIDMCNKEYGNNTSLKNGCLFLANWMDAANNPEVDFVEVECPQALKDKY